jgi:arylamine N-acetyltransferase
MLSRTAVDQYLDHIGVTLTDAKPTLDDLRAIQRAHACRVPFENLCTVRNHRFVSELGIETGLPALDHEALMQTIVHKQR